VPVEIGVGVAVTFQDSHQQDVGRQLIDIARDQDAALRAAQLVLTGHNVLL